jgi:tetratricopeptide (TPR) repeat protein
MEDGRLPRRMKSPRPGKGWTVNNRMEQIADLNSRLLLDRSPAGGRLRRRTLAGGGLSLLVLGFLLAIGLGRIVFLAAGIVLLVAFAPVLIAGARRVRPRLRLPKPARPRLRLPGLPRVELPRRSRRAPSRRQALRLNARGTDYRRRGDYRRAVEAHGEALSIMRAADDRAGEALTLNNLALALAHAGHDEAALDRFEAALAILRELHDEQREGQVFANLGLMHGRRGRREQALGCLQVALEKLDPDSSAYRRVEEQLSRAS